MTSRKKNEIAYLEKSGKSTPVLVLLVLTGGSLLKVLPINHVTCNRLC